jgi:DNA-binding beta-propeller fold protein YncE
MRRVFVQHTYGLDVAGYEETDGGFRETGRISLGGEWKPDSVGLSPDGRLLYTNWSDLAWRRIEHRGAAHSCFTAHDAATLAPVWRLDLDSGVQHFAADPTGRYYWNAVFDRPRTIRVDVETRTAEYVETPFLGGHKVRVSADGKRCYVGSMTHSELAEIDTATLKCTRRFAFPDLVRPFVLTKDGKTAFVQVSRTHGFYDFDLEAGAIRRFVELPPLPADTPVEAEWPYTVDHGIEISKDGRFLCVLATTGNYMAVYALPGPELVKTVPLGVEPSYLSFSPEGDALYITNRVKGGLMALSVPEFEVVKHLAETGRRPQRVVVGRRS